MRILWIAKEPSPGQGGEDIFDRKMVAALRKGHEVDIVCLEQVGKAHMLANIALRFLPHHRARYTSAANVRRVSTTLRRGYDAAFCSWEPLDYIAYLADGPIIPVLHNITSASFRSIFSAQPVGLLGADLVERWERRIYGSDRFDRIAVLSRDDARILQAISGRDNMEVIWPGMPPAVPLTSGVELRSELVLHGSYDWFAKRRDMLAFARDYAKLADRYPVFSDSTLPGEAEAALESRPLSDIDPAAAIRFGIIADRFTAGHKLKTTSYIAFNCIVITFSDVSCDFDDIADYGFFIRRVSSVREIRAVVESMYAIAPAELRERFLDFQRKCAARFSWDSSARRLVALAKT